MDLERENNEKEIEDSIFGHLKELSKSWGKGGFDRLKRENPELYERVKDKERHVNDSWLKFRKGLLSLEELKKTIEEWIDSLKKCLEHR